MDWRQILHVSEKLNPGPYPDGDDHKLALTRSGISRAYYAAHNVARLYAKNKGYYWTDDHGKRYDWPQHEMLWDVFKGSHDADEQTVGDKGHSLRTMRNRADYDAGLSANSLIQDHRFALKNAYEICALLKQPFEPWQRPGAPPPMAATKKK